MKKLCCLSLVLIIAVAEARGQKQLVGVVVDENGAGVENASVRIYEHSTLTDHIGVFGIPYADISTVRQNLVNVTVVKEGYQTKEGTYPTQIHGEILRIPDKIILTADEKNKDTQIQFYPLITASFRDTLETGLCIQDEGENYDIQFLRMIENTVREYDNKAMILLGCDKEYMADKISQLVNRRKLDSSSVDLEDHSIKILMVGKKWQSFTPSPDGLGHEVLMRIKIYVIDLKKGIVTDFYEDSAKRWGNAEPAALERARESLLPTLTRFIIKHLK